MPIRKRLSVKRNSVAPVETGANVSPVKKSKRTEGSAAVYLSPPTLGNDVGVVLTCGQGDFGCLGLGESVTLRKWPTLVSNLDAVVQVCAGGMHTVCINKNGEVFTFGCNDDGVLGRDTSVEGSDFIPGRVNLPARAVQISAGDSHTAALLEDGRVFAWGSFRDSKGSMGLTEGGIQTTPLHMLPTVKFAKISSGSDHLVMLTQTEDVYTCGCGERGQLGRVTERAADRGGSRKGIVSLLKPALVKLGGRKKSKFSDIWTVNYGTLVKKSESDVIYIFGLNNYNQLGLEDTGCHFHPKHSSEFSGKKWIKICGGPHHTLALDSEGVVYSLGREEYGRLGLGQGSGDAKQLTSVMKKCIDVGCGDTVSFAVTDTGQLYGWGMGTNRQLGFDSEDDVYQPTVVQGKQLETRRVTHIDAGGQHTVLLATP